VPTRVLYSEFKLVYNAYFICMYLYTHIGDRPVRRVVYYYYYYLLFGVVIVGPSIASRPSWSFSSATPPPSTYNIIIIHTTRSWMTILLTFHTYNTYLPNGAAVPRSALRRMYYIRIRFWLINRLPTYHTIYRRQNVHYKVGLLYGRSTVLLSYTIRWRFETGGPRCAGLLQRVRVSRFIILLLSSRLVWLRIWHYITYYYVVLQTTKGAIEVRGKNHRTKIETSWSATFAAHIIRPRRTPQEWRRNTRTAAAIAETRPLAIVADRLRLIRGI